MPVFRSTSLLMGLALDSTVVGAIKLIRLVRLLCRFLVEARVFGVLLVARVIDTAVPLLATLDRGATGVCCVWIS